MPTADTATANTGTIRTPSAANGDDPAAWTGYRLLEIRRAGHRLNQAPYMVALPPRRPLTVDDLVNTTLTTVGFHDDHAWLLSQPPAPRGRRRIGTTHTWQAPADWDTYFGPRDCFPEWVDQGAYRTNWLVAAAYTVDELFDDADEAHLMYDFGDVWTFRLRLLNLDRGDAATRTARALLTDPNTRDAGLDSVFTDLDTGTGISYTPDQVTGPVLLAQPDYGLLQYPHAEGTFHVMSRRKTA